MKRDYALMVMIGCIGFLFGTLLGLPFAYHDNITLKREAVEKGFAGYNRVTGEWEWSDSVH